MSSMRNIVLASQSPRRQDLLKSLGLRFTVDVSGYDESQIAMTDPHEFVEYASLQKANTVCAHNPDSIVISADTVVYHEGKILGKPRDEDDAYQILKTLSGTTHQVVSGFTIIDTSTSRCVTRSAEATLTMRQLDNQLIRRYIRSGHPMDKAGSYGYLGIGTIIIDCIEGDFYTVIGLPMRLLIEELEGFGIDLLPKL